MFGPSLYKEIGKTFVMRPTTFRVNTIKAQKAEVNNVLKQSGFKTTEVSWYRDAFILQNKSKRELMELEIYKEGNIYIQSLASMVPPLVLDPQPGERVLDLTAAPGSKTSQMAAMMRLKGELIANDNNKVRFFKLQHNMEHLGVRQEDGFLSLRMEHGEALVRAYPEYFDKILLDAPCSAEARFVAGVPKTYGYWSERKIKEMAYKQRKLLLAAWSALNPGGVLVYSTCTFAPEENEVQISRLLERCADAQIEPITGLTGIRTLPICMEWKGRALDTRVRECLRVFPTGDSEGFFVARVGKARLSHSRSL